MKNFKNQKSGLNRNEKFEKRKCAYFLRNVKGKWSFKPFSIFFKYPLWGYCAEAVKTPEMKNGQNW